MMYGLLLLGLLPLMFMTDLFSGNDADEASEEDNAALDEVPTTNGLDPDLPSPPNLLDFAMGIGSGFGSGLGPTDPVEGNDTGESDPAPDALPTPPVAEHPDEARQSDDPDDPDNAVLQPTDPDDEAPGTNEPIDPDDIIAPTDPDDEEPGTNAPVNPDDVLNPIDTPDEGLPQDGTLLEEALQRDADATAGLDDFEIRLGETEEQQGTDGDDTIALDDDGIDGTGDGQLDLHDGTPLIHSSTPIDVVDGGGGDDVITTGDSGAYAFGGEGNDTIATGDGAAAVFGGGGNDALTGSDGDNYLDGGAGNDVIQGGDGDEVLKGGVHAARSTESDDDWIHGGAGNDNISGGLGADTLSGGAGDDVIDHNGLAIEDAGETGHQFGWHVDGNADVLDGGAGNDTILMDSADTATGGEGHDTFWLYDDDSGTDHAEVTDFQPGEDFLRVELNPDTAGPDPMLEVLPSSDGLDGEVFVDGALVAVLHGAPGASTADVMVSVQHNLYR